MSKTLGMIHTVGRLAAGFEQLCEEILPDVDYFSISDEGVLQMVMQAGQVTPAIHRRVADDVVCAEEAGADVVLVTCSSISPCVGVAEKMVAVPALRIDQAMVEKAISIGKTVGVVATASTTLKPTSNLVEERSRAARKDAQVRTVLCEGAHEAMLAGEDEQHDVIVRRYLYDMMEICDVVILAQASMARVADQIPEAEREVPILSSPRLAMEKVRQIINQL
jgi:Asp/Glu/hydantoin racemase